MKNNNKIFVYGTLKRGQGNHGRLANAVYLGKARTVKNFTMYVDVLPYLYREEDGPGVIGEIYEVDDDTLETIDRLEGHPILYKREKIKLDDGKEVFAYIYQGKITNAESREEF